MHSQPKELPELPFTINRENSFTRGLGHQGHTDRVTWTADTEFPGVRCPNCKFTLAKERRHHCNFAEPPSDEVHCLGCGMDLLEWDARQESLRRKVEEARR